MIIDITKSRNALILPQNLAVKEFLCEHSKLVDYNYRDSIVEARSPMGFVDFPEYGVLSIIHRLKANRFIEVASIGNEGMLGAGLILGTQTFSEQVICHISGYAWRLPKERFLELIDEHKSFRTSCLNYVARFIDQMSFNFGCNANHTMLERCARFFLLTQDRMGADSFSVTQDLLSQIMNVSRTRVNLAALDFAKGDTIRYVRGKVTILNREALLTEACGCYINPHAVEMAA